MIEVKIRYKGDCTKWEDLPVMGEYFTHELTELIDLLSKAHSIQEIRWNYKGSAQGHYTFGNYAEFKS